MLLAQTTVDAVAQVPLWLTLLVTVLGSIGGSALTLAIGWFLVSRTEAYRRESRWEPIAGQLWTERATIYQQLAEAALETYLPLLHGTYGTSTTVASPQLYFDFWKKRARFSPIVSEPVGKAAVTFGGSVFAWVSCKTNEERIQKLGESVSSMNALIDEMRRDLGVAPIDASASLIFPQDPALLRKVAEAAPADN